MTIGSLLSATKRLSAEIHASLAGSVTPPITPGEGLVLEVLLAQDEPMPIRDIVARTSLAQSWVSSVVRSLEQRGWVALTASPTDGRVTLVGVTGDISRGAQKALARDAAPILGELLPTATSAELKTVQRALDILGEHLGAEAETERSQRSDVRGQSPSAEPGKRMPRKKPQTPITPHS